MSEIEERFGNDKPKLSVAQINDSLDRIRDAQQSCDHQRISPIDLCYYRRNRATIVFSQLLFNRAPLDISHSHW